MKEITHKGFMHHFEDINISPVHFSDLPPSLGLTF